jgi:hypothetical protein
MPPLNIISGRVVLKENLIGIPDLLVVIHDLDPGTASEEALGPTQPIVMTVASVPVLPGLGDRLGSRLTNAQGAFRFEFLDEEFRIRNEKEKRPDLHLVVLAHEEPGLDPSARVLYTSSDIRQDAGRTEEYLIRLSAEALKRIGIPIPLEPAVAKEDALKVTSKLAASVAWRAKVVKESRKIAAARVATAREETRRTDDIVERRLRESLMGMTAEEAERLNIVPAGERPERAVWGTAQRRVATMNGQPPVTGYLVLRPEDAERFQVNGVWRTDVPATEIEPFMFRTSEAEGRPTSIVRNDAIEAMCRAASPADPFTEPTSTGGSGDASGNGSGTSDGDAPVNEVDLPRFVGRLINQMTAPEDTNPGASFGRPNIQDVQQNIAGLRLSSGPADVTAFHDYHNLQIAFDYVWNQLVNEDVIETGKALAHRLEVEGGDPVAALAGAGDPIGALKRETQVIARTNDPFGKQLPEWAVSDLGGIIKDPTKPPSGGGGGDGGKGPDDDGDDEITGGGNGTTGGGGKGPKGDVIGPKATDNDIGELTPHELLVELEGMLNEKYKFEVFAPGSTNFGLLVTYRQKWEPVTYQAGDLAHTITLAPKETRKVVTKRTIKRERSVKETETNLRNQTDESKSTMRADAEVVDRANTKTAFSMSSKGSFEVYWFSGDHTTSADRTAEASSQETKKSFHENVLSAAMQLRSERGWSFESKESYEEETTTTSELINPNDELTVTYLFYELERRYRVSEHLHRLTPVVLVGMEVPNPGRRGIDRILLAHSWVINRVLLDDRYRAPLEYLCKRIVGDELGLAQLANAVAEVKAALEQLKVMHKGTQKKLFDREWTLNTAIRRRARGIAEEAGEGSLETAWEWVTGGGDDQDIESARVMEDMERESYDRAVREEKEIRMRLDAETAALTAATQAYAKAYAEHMNRRMEVGGLRAHFKENILYYMQAIWSHTFQDQIFFSLCNVKAPLIKVQGAKTYSVSEMADPPLSIPAGPGKVVLGVTANIQLAPPVDIQQDAVTLSRIADLDRPLGFKGNYMIFPLKQSNPLTDLMMMPYVDSELGLHDPDDLGAWSPEDFARYARCLIKAHRKLEELSEPEIAALEVRLKDQYQQIVSSPRRVSDEIVVPTNSLFIEALPGKHPLLEDFKLAHRRMDMEKAREENRKLKLESLRYAARILDSVYDDPEIERQIVINGSRDGVVVPAEE